MNNQAEGTKEVVSWLRQPETIRMQARRLYALALEDKLAHFKLEPAALDKAVDLVIAVTRQNYPKLDVPYHSRWRHFSVNNFDRIKAWQLTTGKLDSLEWGQRLYELVIISVLVDAGAGDKWRFHDQQTGQVLTRSEGLAIASLELYLGGHLSCDPDSPYRVDGERLLQITPHTLASVFQVSAENPLNGLEGRATLLNKLGAAICQSPQHFGGQSRLGGFFQSVIEKQQQRQIAARDIFSAVLTAFSPIWPTRSTWQGESLGDVWPHSALRGDRAQDELVPFHKLSQWLSYSLVEPLEEAGIAVTGLDELTGLPEYRNGGLFIDLGALAPRHDSLLREPQDPTSEPIVEWRALTLVLLDELAVKMREALSSDAKSLPLAKVLQGGSWAAGRLIASKKRRDGAPPIQIISDGTIF